MALALRFQPFLRAFVPLVAVSTPVLGNAAGRGGAFGPARWEVDWKMQTREDGSGNAERREGDEASGAVDEALLLATGARNDRPGGGTGNGGQHADVASRRMVGVSGGGRFAPVTLHAKDKTAVSPRFQAPMSEEQLWGNVSGVGTYNESIKRSGALLEETQRILAADGANKSSTLRHASALLDEALHAVLLEDFYSRSLDGFSVPPKPKGMSEKMYEKWTWASNKVKWLLAERGKSGNVLATGAAMFLGEDNCLLKLAFIMYRHTGPDGDEDDYPYIPKGCGDWVVMTGSAGSLRPPSVLVVTALALALIAA